MDSGLGKTVSMGQGLVPPTVSISRTGERLTIDGVEIVFQVTPDTEAPAEMNFFFPQFGALCMAENCTCHLHNIYTPSRCAMRGPGATTSTRPSRSPETDVLFASHHWPRWGSGARRRGFLKRQRDLLIIHDQVLRMAQPLA